jgi:hypothetical protein
MALMTHVFELGLLVWFALLAAIIGGRVLSGEIDTTGFLRTRHHDEVAPERALSMAIFPIVILSYAFSALHADMSVRPPSLPELPDNLLMLLTGGNGLYLAGKIART